MDIREIDDRYPEYARPYEPVKGAKRYKRLGLSSPVALFAITGRLVIFFAFSIMNAPPQILPPEVKPPDVIVTPVPPIDTDPDPTDPVTDPPVEEVDPPEDPTEPVIDPPVEEGPKGPEVSLSAINYWSDVYHAEVIYVITANDAENITSSAVVTSAREPAYSFEVPESAGSGTIRYNADVIEHMEYLSADYWNCVITVNYTLDGESKSETFNLGASPTLADMLWLQDHGTVSSGPVDAKTVTSNLVLSYPSDYRHTFDDAGFWEVRLGWMDSGYNVIYQDSMKTVWNGWIGAGPFSGPTGPVSNGDRMELTYVYSGTVDATAPGPADYFYLEFSYGGDAYDTYDGAVYDVRNPETVRTFPQSLSGSFTEPTVQLGDIIYWGEFNGPYGLHHIEVDYNITPNDADPGSITSDVTLQAYYTDTSDPYPVSGHTVSATGISGSGDLAANMNSAGIMYYNSGESWQTVITMHYTVGGEAKTTTVTFDPKKPDKHYRLDMYTVGNIEVMEIFIEYALDDPHVYDLRITEMALQFAVNESGYWQALGDPVTIWTEADGDIFSGPDVSDLDSDNDGNPDMMVIHFITGPDTLTYSAISGMSVPPEATHFRLIFKAEGTGTDSRDSAVYTVVGGITNWIDTDDDYIDLP